MAATKSDTSGVRIFPPAIYLAGLAVGFLLFWLWPVHLGPPGAVLALRVAGGLLMAVGLALPLWAAATFRGVGTTVNPTRPTTALAFGGPYRFTRNPMYLGLALLSAGVALVANALWPLLPLPFVLWIVRRIVIDREERYLDAKFGDKYLEYKKRVRRWV
jgi:protein-S-isoprenylcysteine O-methyltransferase Ste14